MSHAAPRMRVRLKPRRVSLAMVWVSCIREHRRISVPAALAQTAPPRQKMPLSRAERICATGASDPALCAALLLSESVMTCGAAACDVDHFISCCADCGRDAKACESRPVSLARGSQRRQMKQRIMSAHTASERSAHSDVRCAVFVRERGYCCFQLVGLGGTGTGFPSLDCNQDIS